jgi:hypothetical protein
MSDYTETYLNSDILIGFTDGSTWLLTDEAQPETTDLPNRHTIIISACNPGSKPASIEENLFATQALERKLAQNNLNYALGWGKDRGNAVAEISFCIEIVEPESRDAIADTLIELAREFGQNALFEVKGNQVSLIALSQSVKGTRTKHAKRLVETQEQLAELYQALNWATDPTKEESQAITDLINELKERN